jgi:hypothetical protein
MIERATRSSSSGNQDGVSLPVSIQAQVDACLNQLLQDVDGQTVLLVRHSGTLVAWQGEADAEMVQLYSSLRHMPEEDPHDLSNLLVYQTLLVGEVWKGGMCTRQAVGESWRLEISFRPDAPLDQWEQVKHRLEQAAQELEGLMSRREAE